MHQFWDCHSEQAVSFPSGDLLSIPRMRKTTHRQENKRAQSFNQGELTSLVSAYSVFTSLYSDNSTPVFHWGIL